MSVKIKKSDLKPLVKKATSLVTALEVDLQTLKSIGAKSTSVKETVAFLKSLKVAVRDFDGAEDCDDEEDARKHFGGLQDLCDDYVIDETIDPVFVAMDTLGIKSKVKKLIGEETLGEFVGGLAEDFSTMPIEEIEDKEEEE